MKHYMLDTDISSYLIRGDHPEVTEKFTDSFPHVCISTITAAELQYGAMKRNNLTLTRKVQAFCNLVQCIDWNTDAAMAYAKLRQHLEAQGNIIGSMDMLIAASAIAEDAILVTNNTAHFSRITGLKFENWLKKQP
ncbi:MAG: type II toxin-antitoxin system VapC family toxin [Victivallales bacterium]|nr:type II toxin-antitoxin system VapC family toxin [Victivallales bacterium]